GKPDLVLKELQTASTLDPNLAGPHFQLSNTYRGMGKAEDAERELKVFQEIKKRTAGAAVPEDLEWSTFAEIYDVGEPQGVPQAASSVEPKLQSKELSADFGAKNAGLALLDAGGKGSTDLLAWSANQVRLYSKGSQPVDAGLSGLKNVVSIAPGDFNNDGLA